MSIKDEQDWSGLRAVGRVAAESLEAMREAVAPGLTTEELDAIGRAVLDRHRALSAPRLSLRIPGKQLGSGRAYLASDGWTARTHDGRIAAHDEHTVVITKELPKVLTAYAA